jgi:hypothetical protein
MASQGAAVEGVRPSRQVWAHPTPLGLPPRIVSDAWVQLGRVVLGPGRPACTGSSRPRPDTGITSITSVGVTIVSRAAIVWWTSTSCRPWGEDRLTNPSRFVG